MTHRITAAAPTQTGLSVTVDGTEKRFPWLWVRDHSQDAQAYHQAARQRLVETFELGSIAPADRIEITDDVLSVAWEGTPESRFTADYLARVDVPGRAYDVIGGERTTWDAESVGSLVKVVDHARFLEDDAVLAEALEHIRRCGLVSLKNVPTTIAASRAVMERISYIRSSIFGEMWELKSDGKIADTGSTPLEITPHNDGTYNHDAPGLMSLHCLEYKATGGDNVLVDGFRIAEIIRRDHPKAYEVLSRVEVPGQYIGDGAYLVARRPVLRHDGAGALMQVSFNNHDRAPFALPEAEMTELYEALGVFAHLIRDRANQYAFGQREGDMVIFDNWRLLHGRLAFEGQRHMVGSYLNREDFESRMRMLRPRPLDMVADDA